MAGEGFRDGKGPTNGNSRMKSPQRNTLYVSETHYLYVHRTNLMS